MVDKPMKAARKIALERLTTGQFILLGVGLVLAIALFVFLRGFVSCWQLTALPGMAPSTCASQESNTSTNPEETPVAVTATPTVSAPQSELPPAWDGASRVTVLFIGLDDRPWVKDEGAPRSDTMLLLTVDPLSKTAGMLSIPRDMWVNIPGFGYNKINTAYKFGEDRRLTGGGRALAEKTVEDFLGVNIDYFIQVKFRTFIKVIDHIGGIDVNIPNEITVGLYGGNGGTVVLQPGLQHLDGLLALGYARNRYTENGDIDRANRQQQVILAIRDKVVSDLPGMVARAPALYSDVSSGITTDISFNDALRLGILVAKDIPFDSIQKGVIDYTMMEPGTATVDGQKVDILRPYPDKIRELVDQIFGGGAMKPMASGDPTRLMQDEAARVTVVNASGVNGLALQTGDYLKAQGMNVIGVGNHADFPEVERIGFPLYRSYIIIHTGKPYAMKYLMALMNFGSQSQVIVDFDPSAAEDIILAVGTDWAGNNPMPPATP